MPSHSSLLLLVTVWASVQDGLGLPVVKQPEAEAVNGVQTHPVRTKRCACSNLLDSECHYFCHLDIIWVNTPSKTTIYGLGGGLLRRKGSLGAAPAPGSMTRPAPVSAVSGVSIKTVLLGPEEVGADTNPEIQSVKRPQLDTLNTSIAGAKDSNPALDVEHSGKEQSSQAERKNA